MCTSVSIADWKIPEGIVLAAPQFNKAQPVDLIIGAKHYYSLFPSSARLQLSDQLPWLIESVFGWIVAGSATVQFLPHSPV